MARRSAPVWDAYWLIRVIGSEGVVGFAAGVIVPVVCSVVEGLRSINPSGVVVNPLRSYHFTNSGCFKSPLAAGDRMMRSLLMSAQLVRAVSTSDALPALPPA